MKCPNCGFENRATVRFCKKCSVDMTKPPVWFFDARWHLKALLVIYIVLTALYFLTGHLLRKLPPPYDQRIIPAEMTPWLNPKKHIEH